MRLNTISEALSKSLLEKTATVLGLSNSELRSSIALADVDDIRLPNGDWICKQFGEEFNTKDLGGQDQLKRIRLLTNFAAKIKELLEAFVVERVTFTKLRLSKNINDYTLASLKKAIHDAVSSNVKETNGVEKLGTTGGLAVYKVTDEIQLAKLGEGTSWCTRKSYPPGSRASYYIEEHGWLYVVLKNNKPFMQICSNLSEPRDARNEETAIPPEIMKIILPTAKFNSQKFFVYLERASSAKDKNLVIDLIDYVLRQGQEVPFATFSHDDVARNLALLAEKMSQEEFEKTLAFCLKSPPDLMVAFVRALPGHIDPEQAEYAADKIDMHIADTVKALLSKIMAADNISATSLFFNGARWFLIYLASSKISNWPALDEALAHAVGGKSMTANGMVREGREKQALFTIADRLLDNNEGSAQNPLPKLTATCTGLIGRPNYMAFLTAFLRRVAAFGDSQEGTIRAALLSEPLSEDLIGHFNGMTERWPEWEEAVFEAWNTADRIDQGDSVAGTVSRLCIEYCRRVLKNARWPKFESWLMQNPWVEVTGLSPSASESGLAAAEYAMVAEMRPWPEMARVMADGIGRSQRDTDRTPKSQPTEAVVMGLLEVAYDGDQVSSEERVGDLFTTERLARFISESMRPSSQSSQNSARLKNFNYGQLSEDFDDRLVFFNETQVDKMLDGFDMALEMKIASFQTRLAQIATSASDEDASHRFETSDKRQRLILQTNIENLYKDQLSKCFSGYWEMLILQEEQPTAVPGIMPRFKAFVERIIEAVPELDGLRERATRLEGARLEREETMRRYEEMTRQHENEVFGDTNTGYD